MRDDKYVVFRRSHWEEFAHNMNQPLPPIVEDATVIRGQDLFAAPALHAYANAIGVAAVILKNEGHVHTASRLMDTADYFEDRAMEATEIGYKLPD